MLAEYWRGEITLRKLRVLIQGLPQDSAAHRSATDGQTWTWVEQILWQMIRSNSDNATRITSALSGKKQKPKLIKDADWPKFPWREPDSKPKRFGKVEDRSGEEVMAFLDSFG